MGGWPFFEIAQKRTCGLQAHSSRAVLLAPMSRFSGSPIVADLLHLSWKSMNWIAKPR